MSNKTRRVAQGIMATATVLGTLLMVVPTASASTTGSIEGSMFFDRNGNGTPEANEPGKVNAGVWVYDSEGAVVDHLVTDEHGNFELHGLPADRYRVDGGQPGFASTTPKEVTVEVRAGRTAGVGFGVRGATISGQAWLDTNSDGIRQPDEPNESRASGFTLSGTRDHIGPIRLASSRDPEGRYVFNDLPSGSYLVQIASPNGLAATKVRMGSDRGVDSDFIGERKPNSLPYTEMYRFEPGASFSHVDAGFVRLS